MTKLLKYCLQEQRDLVVIVEVSQASFRPQDETQPMDPLNFAGRRANSQYYTPQHSEAIPKPLLLYSYYC